MTILPASSPNSAANDRIGRRIICLAFLGMMCWACGNAPDSTEPAETPLADSNHSADLAEQDPAFVEACAEVPGCAEQRYEAPERYETIWRVLVSKEPDGAIEIERAEPIEVPEGDGVPLGPLSGSHLLAGLDESGKPVEGQWIRFPQTLHLEFQDAELPPSEIDISDRPVDTVGYVRALPSVETIAVLEESGRVIVSEPAPAKVAGTAPAAGSIFASPAFAQSTPRRGSRFLPPYCAHIRLIEGPEERDLVPGIAYEEVITLVHPGNKQRSNIWGALGLMTPLLCQSVSRIAVGRIPVNAQIGGASLPILGVVNVVRTGDLIVINDVNFPELTVTLPDLLLMKVLTHEAAHSATTLLDVESSRPSGEGAWRPSARTLAELTIAHTRLELGLRREWESLIDSFKKVGWAKPYGALRSLEELSSEQLTEGGFMSAYGGVNLAEDIAEMVSWTYYGTLYDQIAPDHVLREDKACQQMRSYQEENLPSRYTAAYTKLKLLENLGLVHPRDFEHCTGPKLGLPDMSPGFESWREGRRRNTFSTNVSAGIDTELLGGNRVFEMRAEGQASFGGKTYPATLTLRLDLEDEQYPIELVSWPRGVYRLGLMGDNNFSISLEGNLAGSFDSIEGYVLVVEASNRRIAGSIFLTKVLEYSIPPTPEVFDPPMIVRFLLEK